MSVNRRKRNERTRDGARVAFGNPNRRNVSSVQPPPLRDGQHRCPVCRNGASLTPRGLLRKHRDLFGHDCYNRATGEPTGIAAPPVAIPAQQTPPTSMPSKAKPRPAAPEDGRLRRPDGRCHECDRPVSGERRFCGACLARRSR